MSEITFAVTIKADSPNYWNEDEACNTAWLAARIEEGLHEEKWIEIKSIEQIHGPTDD